MRFRFRKRDRVRKRREFLAIQSSGRKRAGTYFIVLVATGGSGRLGITVSKKVGNAVTRNRIKRHVREFVRQAKGDGASWLPAGCDVVVVARPSAASAGARQVADDLERLGAGR